MAAVLNSWKEISSYLGRGVRTVQRWERDHHLPVHRIGVGPRAPVFAYVDEVTVWQRGFATGLPDANPSCALSSEATRLCQLKRQRQLLGEMKQLRQIQQAKLAALLRTLNTMENRVRISAMNGGKPMLTSGPQSLELTTAA